MDEAARRQLEDEVRYRAAIRGQRMAILGATATAAALVAALHRDGMVGALVGVFDHRISPDAGGGVLPMDEIARHAVDALVVADDAEKEALLWAYRAVDDRLPEVILAGTAHFAFRDPEFHRLLHEHVGVSLANGYPESLIHLYECLRFAGQHRLEGDIAEFGVFKGGTTLLLARFARHWGLTKARVFGFDTFGGFPPRRSVFDLYARPGCVFTDVEAVRRLCAADPGIELVVGDIAVTRERIAGRPLVLSFFDTDNYTPARAALELCATQTVVGGSILFDHYTSVERFRYTIGERMAANELLADSGFFHLHGTGVFTRIV